MDVLDSTPAWIALQVSSDKQSMEMEDGSSAQSSSSQGIEEEGNVDRNIPNNHKEDQDYGSTETEYFKKMSNIRDIFDSDSD